MCFCCASRSSGTPFKVTAIQRHTIFCLSSLPSGERLKHIVAPRETEQTRSTASAAMPLLFLLHRNRGGGGGGSGHTTSGIGNKGTVARSSVLGPCAEKMPRKWMQRPHMLLFCLPVTGALGDTTPQGSRNKEPVRCVLERQGQEKHTNQAARCPKAPQMRCGLSCHSAPTVASQLVDCAYIPTRCPENMSAFTYLVTFTISRLQLIQISFGLPAGYDD